MKHILSLLLLAFCVSSFAARIEYTAEPLGGTSWRYDYTLFNDDTPSVPIEEFTIYFDGAYYANLTAAAGPTGWDILVIQPDVAIPDDGFFDGLSLSGPAAGFPISGFSVTFDFLGPGVPGIQAFDFADPATFATLSTGSTTLRSVPPPPPDGSVPSPSTLALVGFGAAMLGARKKRRQGVDERVGRKRK